MFLSKRISAKDTLINTSRAVRKTIPCVDCIRVLCSLKHSPKGWCTGKPRLLWSRSHGRADLCCCRLRATALTVQPLLLPASWASSALTHTLHPPGGTDNPRPHKGGHWHSVMTQGDPEGSTVTTGLLCPAVSSLGPPVWEWPSSPSVGRSGRTWGIPGAEQRRQEGRLAGLALLRWEKGFNCCTPLPEGNSGEEKSSTLPSERTTQAARWEIPIKHEEKNSLVRLPEYWVKLLRKAVEMPLLQVHPGVCTPQLDMALSDLIYLWQQSLFKKEADTRDHFKPKFVYNFYDATNTD